jgi:toxin-antitoxin system PIN domain toxin
VESLLDVNALIALFWAGHPFHQRMQRWFARHARAGWATCPFTEAGFVLILSNPRFSAHAVSPSEAIEVLQASRQHTTHRFWADDLPVSEAIQPFQQRLVVHQQVTDAYLLGLALRKKGKLATLDEGIASLLPGNGQRHSCLEIIP